MTDSKPVEITALGAQGDGVAETESGQIFIPGALPGEQWRAPTPDQPAERLSTSPDRQTPVCRHYLDCGGCVSQHMAPKLYAEWKVSALVSAFAHRGIDVAPDPLLSVGVSTRRRTTFGFSKTGQKFLFGYYRAASHELVNISECHVVDRKIASAIADLRGIANCCAANGQSGRLVVTVVNDGLHVTMTADKVQLSPDQRSRLTQHALASGVVSLLLNGEPIIEAGPTLLTINDADIALRPDTFLQASPDAEQHIAELVISALGRAKKVADLFCGVGTFTFPIARKKRVTAFDGDKAAIATLNDAVARNQGYKPIGVHQRDLFRDPLSARELRDFEAVVINPPRAGAGDQCERLAKSTVKTIVMVACNPATLARDAKMLLDGGYDLTRLAPIDQFVFTAHLETVAVFQRAPSASKRST